jgi:hypothetical protein
MLVNHLKILPEGPGLGRLAKKSFEALGTNGLIQWIDSTGCPNKRALLEIRNHVAGKQLD